MSPIHHMGRTRRGGDRFRLVTFRVKCFVWSEKLDRSPMVGFGFAADISESGAGIYLDFGLSKGSMVEIALESEDATRYQGIVIWSQRHSLEQKFKGHPSMNHRVGVKFLFPSEPDRQRYLMYFNDLRKRAVSITGEFRF